MPEATSVKSGGQLIIATPDLTLIYAKAMDEEARAILRQMAQLFKEEIADLDKEIARVRGLLTVANRRIGLLEQWKAIHLGEMDTPRLSLPPHPSPNDIYGRMEMDEKNKKESPRFDAH